MDRSRQRSEILKNARETLKNLAKVGIKSDASEEAKIHFKCWPEITGRVFNDETAARKMKEIYFRPKTIIRKRIEFPLKDGRKIVRLKRQKSGNMLSYGFLYYFKS